jgi:hypothetical protein
MMLVPPICGDVSGSKIAISARRLATGPSRLGSADADGAVVGAVMLIEATPVIFRVALGSKIIVADTPGAVVSEPLPPS